jgi:hypothetical protein
MKEYLHREEKRRRVIEEVRPQEDREYRWRDGMASSEAILIWSGG